VGLAGLVAFAVHAGMQLWVAILYLLLILAIFLALGRIRAEFGLPKVSMCCTPAVDEAFQRIAGNDFWTPQDRTFMTLMFFIERAYDQTPMANQVDAVRLGHRSGLALPSVSAILLLATGLGAVAAFWAHLHSLYQLGFESAKCNKILVWAFGTMPWNRLAASLQYPQAAQPALSLAYLAGLGFTFVLAALRTRFLWWPLHPVGYLVIGSYDTLRIWFPVFVTWLVKTAILRYGGLSLHHRAQPFFLGLILGEFSAGFLRTILDLAFRLYLPAMSGIGGL